MLCTEAVSFARGRQVLFEDLSLGIQPGAVCALIGPNGAGKSTLLHLLSGALAPSRGRVLLEGRPLAGWSRADLARTRAVLAQGIQMAFPFPALDVVLMGRLPHAGFSTRRQDLAVAHAALDAVDALAFAHRPFTSLSGGEQQRVSLARVLAQVWPGPGVPAERYILLDEPTSALDLAHQHALMALVGKIARQGVGVVTIVHDPNLAALYADRVIGVASGKVQADGGIEQVVCPAVMERIFGVAVVVQRHPRCDRPHVVVGGDVVESRPVGCGSSSPPPSCV